MDELEKNEKLAEQQLDGKEFYELKRKQKEESKEREQRKEALGEAPKKIGRYLLYSLIGIGIVAIIGKSFGKHFLDIKKQNKNSNWQDHKVTKQPLEKYYRTF